MKGFILANGHSGTTWAARALSLATDLDARHESWRHDIGRDFGGVESNGNLWKRAGELGKRWPDAGIVHLVRDGRKVVRTIMFHHKPDFFEAACRRWNNRNERLFIEVCNANRFKLETITTDFRAFASMAETLGAKHFRQAKWEQIRAVRINASTSADAQRFPPYNEWDPEQKEIFRRICGDMMRSLRYWTGKESRR